MVPRSMQSRGARKRENRCGRAVVFVSEPSTSSSTQSTSVGCLVEGSRRTYLCLSLLHLLLKRAPSQCGTSHHVQLLTSHITMYRGVSSPAEHACHWESFIPSRVGFYSSLVTTPSLVLDFRASRNQNRNTAQHPNKANPCSSYDREMLDI